MSGEGNATRFELSHDAIARLVFDQASAEAQTRRKIEKYIRDRLAMHRERGPLLTRDDLDYIHPHLGAIHAEPDERAFIQASERAVRRSRNRRRLVVAGVIAVLAASTGVSGVMAVRAEGQRKRAEAERLFNEAQAQLAGGALLDAVLTARTSARTFPTDTASTRTQYAVLADPTPVLVTIREPVDSRPRVRFSMDGRRILSLSENSYGSFATRIWDWNRAELLSLPQTIRAEFARRSTAVIAAQPSAPAKLTNDDGSGCTNSVREDGGPGSRVGAWLIVDLTQPSKRSALPIGFQSLAANGTSVSVCGNLVSIHDGQGALLRSVRIPGVRSAAFTPDGTRIVVSTGARSAVYDLAGGKLLDVNGEFATVAADGDLFATIEDAVTVIRDGEGRELARREGVAPVFGPNGTVLTVTGQTSRLWRPSADGTVGMVEFPGGDPRISPDGVWVMTTVDGRTRVADVFGRELTTLDGVSGQFSPIGPVAMTATTSGVIRLWDLRRTAVATTEAAAQIWGLDELTTRSLSSLDGPPDCRRACESPDGLLRAHVKWMGVTPGAPFNVTLVLEAADRPAADDSSRGAARADEVAADAGADGWHALPPLPTRTCLGPASVGLSPMAGGGVVFGCGDGIVRVFDRAGAVRWESKHGAVVTHAGFSPDGGHVVTGSADRSARLWNAATGAAVAAFAGHESDVIAAILSKDATRVATLTTRGTLRLWQPDGTGAVLLSSVALNDATIESIMFSADGSMILARTNTGHYRRWRTDAARLDEEFAWLPDRPAAAVSPNAGPGGRR